MFTRNKPFCILRVYLQFFKDLLNNPSTTESSNYSSEILISLSLTLFKIAKLSNFEYNAHAKNRHANTIGISRTTNIVQSGLLSIFKGSRIPMHQCLV